MLTFNETVKLAINSLVEGIVDKNTAIDMIEIAAHNRCVGCKREMEKIFVMGDEPYAKGKDHACIQKLG